MQNWNEEDRLPGTSKTLMKSRFPITKLFEKLFNNKVIWTPLLSDKSVVQDKINFKGTGEIVKEETKAALQDNYINRN